AARAAKTGLTLADEEGALASLYDALGIAESYTGDFAAAREHLERATRIHGQAGAARRQARSMSYLALADYRAGDTLRAARGFKRAMELAVNCGAADLVSYAAQNLGSVCHQLGDYGAALASYQQALEVAQVVGDRHVEVMLSGNLAKLYVDIGLDERA